MHSATPITGLPMALLAWWMTAAILPAATLTIQETTPGSMSLHIGSDPLSYFYLKQTTDLKNFTPFSMVLGSQPTTWPLSAEEVPTRFFRVTEISLFAPEDSDGDGIDDVYEIRHPILNPLDATDAAFLSGNGNLTFLQEYQSTLGIDTGPPVVLSREVSSFNFGEGLEASISREVSVFNLGSALFPEDSLSREISVFNGESLPQSLVAQVSSREISTFNFGSAPAGMIVASREISVFNGDSLPSNEVRVVHSREVSSFNFGAPLSRIDITSREISIFNSGNQFFSVDINSREISVINNGQ